MSSNVHVQEALNMVIPAMQLAGKIPDVHVQLWASALLKGLPTCLELHCRLTHSDDSVYLCHAE